MLWERLSICALLNLFLYFYDIYIKYVMEIPCPSTLRCSRTTSHIAKACTSRIIILNEL